MMGLGVTLLAAGGPAVFAANTAEPKQSKPASRPQGRQFERDMTQFLERYRQFLGCCAGNLDAIDEAKALENEAAVLLDQAQTGMASELKKLRGFTLQERLGPVERARNDLRAITKRLEQIQEAENRLEAQELDFFTFHTERRKLQDQLDAIPRDFQALQRPGGSPTGMEIGVVPPTGTEVGTPGQAGPEIGTTPSTGKAIGTTPPTGPAIGERRR